MKTKLDAKCLAIGSGLSALVLSFTACGDDVTKVTQVTGETSGLEIVASADSLGKCTEEISGEMKFASKENAVYVCADSIWQSLSSNTKISCTAESLKDSSGYKIVCGEDSVGVVFNGNDGKNGEAGKAGTSCMVTESPLLDLDFGGGYFVVCGSDTVGTLVSGRDGESCTLTDNGDGSVTQVCGASEVTLYKGFCGGKPFDPDSNVCFKDSIIPQCGGKRYSPAESFCVADSLYPLCNGDRFDPETQFCLENSLYEKCAGETYDPSIKECFEERLYATIKDERDGQRYRIVEIGSQTWMAENLNYNYKQKTNTLDSSSFCYDNNLENCEKFGRLYLWSAAMDSAAVFGEGAATDCGNKVDCQYTANTVRGVCPVGWHLPTKAEWDSLVTTLVGESFGVPDDSIGYALKTKSGWADGKNGSNIAGFSAIPAGFQGNMVGFFDELNTNAYFWTSSESGKNIQARGFGLSASREDLVGKTVNRNWAISVRCVKD